MYSTLPDHRHLLKICLALAMLLSACAAPRVATVPEPGLPTTPFTPAGDWEYVERGQSLLLTLDTEGNGRYPWRNGRIITTAIEGRTWTGIWTQPGNDREGGFELTVTSDHQRADGMWWYNRIGADRKPDKKGGEFSLIRLPDAKSR